MYVNIYSASLQPVSFIFDINFTCHIKNNVFQLTSLKNSTEAWCYSGHLSVDYLELSFQGREAGGWWQDWPEPIWQLLPQSLSFLSEITGHSLFSVKRFEELVPKVGREPGRVDGSLAWCSEDLC